MLDHVRDGVETDDFGFLHLDELGDVLDVARGWHGRNAEFIGSSLLDALVKSLELDFALLRVDDAANVTIRGSETFVNDVGADSVATELALLGALESPSEVNQVTIGGIALSLVRVPLGIVSSIGCLIAGARRDAFPSKLERDCLAVSAAQAALALVGVHGVVVVAQERGDPVAVQRDVLLDLLAFQGAEHGEAQRYVALATQPFCKLFQALQQPGSECIEASQFAQ